jgi:uncharacterized protein (TIGR03083 family)
MQTPQPILTSHLFAPLNQELVTLLRGLTAEEWLASTAAGTWTVKDVAAHLLDTAIRRLSLQRDGHFRPGPFDPNAANREWVLAAERLSPRVLTDLLETWGAQQSAFFESLDPFSPAQWGVTWAGEEHSAMWFDIARELTERWHHQQQIRDATGRGLLRAWLPPVLDTFARALPHAYRAVDAPPGTTVVLRIDEQAWTLLREPSWTLLAGEAPAATTRITLDGAVAWRLFTKGLKRDQVRASVEGEAQYAEPVLSMVTVIG